MINYGLNKFLQAKHLKYHEAVQAFLTSENITAFTSKNQWAACTYVEHHWIKFSSFIDKSIKSGAIQGKAVKLNFYFAEEKARHEQVRAEFEKENLTPNERFIINREHDGPLNSFFSKKGLQMPPKNRDYVSKKLQSMPRVIILRELNLIDELVEYLKANKNERVHTLCS